MIYAKTSLFQIKAQNERLWFYTRECDKGGNTFVDLSAVKYQQFMNVFFFVLI